MKILSVLFLLSAFSVSVHSTVTPEEFESIRHLRDGEFKSQLRSLLSKGQRSLGYKSAKKVMFEKLDNFDGEVCGVYSANYCLRTRSIPNNSAMNTEHTWPQSKGAVGIAKSDLHHLYPTKSKINSTRSNYPFCYVANVKWEGSVSKMGQDKDGTMCFEVPDFHKGNVARAMFYFAVRYSHNISDSEEKVLREWNEIDPVDDAEVERERKIENHQNNTNLFVLYPEIINQISDI
tara:strand:- start:627 stop:1328 length:702 start_codon:yes stop_codon:yes gene_type:complete